MWEGADKSFSVNLSSAPIKDCSHLLWLSPLSQMYKPSLSCVILLTDLHSIARPLLCTKRHLLFLTVLFLESQHPPSKPCQIPWGATLSFPFSHSSFLFLNMFWTTLLFFWFSNLVPWPCWMHQPHHLLTADRSSKLCPFYTGHSYL